MSGDNIDSMTGIVGGRVDPRIVRIFFERVDRRVGFVVENENRSIMAYYDGGWEDKECAGPTERDKQRKSVFEI